MISNFFVQCIFYETNHKLLQYLLIYIRNNDLQKSNPVTRHQAE